MVALNVNAIATYVSNLMKAQSEANTCGVISGTVDGYVLISLPSQTHVQKLRHILLFLSLYIFLDGAGC
jgi:hypothetical protein